VATGHHYRMTRARWLRFGTAVALGLSGVTLIAVSSSIRHQATSAKARTANLSPIVSADRQELRTTGRTNDLLAARLNSTHRMVVSLQQTRDSAQLEAFRGAYEAARTPAYSEAYQAAFPVDLTASDSWYVVRVRKGSGYETASWRAPEGGEYVISGGSVTPYTRGGAPSPYVSLPPDPSTLTRDGLSPYTLPSVTLPPTYTLPGLPSGGSSIDTAPTYTGSTAPGCSESGSCYGDISSATGLPKTTYVPGYTRRDGTYVRSYYRSK
jgi:hypothetical protein